MIKLSDYVFEFIAQKGIKHVFMLPGGGCMHLADSLGRNKNLAYITCLHEQAASIAAEAYGQHTNYPGVALVTTGPGGTNAVTGVSAAFLDSTPVIFISGQVKRSDLKKDSGIRQKGPQEIDIVSIVKSVTKYAVTVLESSQIKYQLEKAWHLAMSGRRGPVWLDIPLDVQAEMIEEKNLVSFDTPTAKLSDLEDNIQEAASIMQNAKRPLILAGNGVKGAGAENLLANLIAKLDIPVLTTWKTIDLFDFDDPHFFGCPGILGHRGANFILQNSDALLVLGSRLDSSLTAFNLPGFAPRAKKIMVDIDPAELNKPNIDIKIEKDTYFFLKKFDKYIGNNFTDQDWLGYCAKMKKKYPACLPEYFQEKDFVNAYAFIDTLCNYLHTDDIIVPESAGAAGEITYQAFKIKKGQKMKNAAALGAMGFGLPYAIGACLASGGKRTILINGDGAFALNMQELATLQRLNLPVKMFIWDNGGYASIMATQRNFFSGNYVGSEASSGLTLPNLKKIARAFDLTYFNIENHGEMEETIKEVLNYDGIALCRVNISPLQITAPKCAAMKLADGTMVSKPLHDMFPFLSEDEVRENMI
ncbi:MAG: thiamine pyrophosphate-binding protein [Sporomusaceae bacterium]|jgi:acetolactate synthase-1/2/3 large subunit|nr:thiamine pyrophosphate-binding protein [Sporomusaceae bacterium]